MLRLNAAGLLPQLDRVSSVSGGSIAAGALAIAWPELRFNADGVATNIRAEVLDPVLELTSRRVDVSAIARGMAVPGRSAADYVSTSLDRWLFRGRSLQDLPQRPRFVFNATNLTTGALLRFSKPYLADHRIGILYEPRVSIADAVAASAAFPPFLAPFTLRTQAASWTDAAGTTHGDAEYRSRLDLVDGGVYDNLALESVWKRCRTVIASDAGSPLTINSRRRRSWPTTLYRVVQVIDSQVRAQRRRQLVASLQQPDGGHAGCLIVIGTPLGRYPALTGESVDDRLVEKLSRIPTRLTRVSRCRQEQLVNWGFRAAEAGIASYVTPGIPALPFPFPDRPMAP